ncbi:hypothetical protein CBL_05142 [Carabus blaptoides fortunei]
MARPHQRASPKGTDLSGQTHPANRKPKILYASPAWGSAAPSNIKIIQCKQSRILRNIANAPWYVKTANIHSDLGIEYITEVIKKTAVTTFLKLETHPCKRIREAANYDEHGKRRYKRPRHLQRKSEALTDKKGAEGELVPPARALQHQTKIQKPVPLDSLP